MAAALEVVLRPAAGFGIERGRVWVQPDALQIEPAVLVDQSRRAGADHGQGGRGQCAGARKREEQSETHGEQSTAGENGEDERDKEQLQRAACGSCTPSSILKHVPSARRVNKLSARVCDAAEQIAARKTRPCATQEREKRVATVEVEKSVDTEDRPADGKH